MQNPVDVYWQKRLDGVGTALEENHFKVFIVQTASEAGDLVLKTLIPAIDPKVVSWGGSMTIGATGIVEVLKKNSAFTVIDPYEPGLKPEEAYERRRQGLLADLFFAGANALTEDGRLVNLDATGNRVAAISFGPRNVVLAISRNKIVPDLDAAMGRVRKKAAPMNAIRLGRKTPCSVTGKCANCKGPDRLCNVWGVTEKSNPRGRIRIILINQDLGF